MSFLTNTKKDPESIIPSPFAVQHENTPKTGASLSKVSLVPKGTALWNEARALRLEAVHITREHRSLADVVQPSSCMVRRSRPMPRPPCGGMPYLCSMVKDSNSSAFILRAASLSICS